MERVKGFIFDLDGVIVDTAKYHYLAWSKLAKSINVEFSERQNEQLKGVSRQKSLEKILEWGDIRLHEEDFVNLMSKKNDDYLSHIDQMTEDEILPNVTKMLDYIKSKHQLMALGSASKNAKAILKKVNLFHVFDAIVDGNDTKKGKPNPEVFLTACKRLNLTPKDCIVFEDAQAGIKAANTAGMISIGIGEKDILHEADYCFKDFTEFDTDFIDTLIAKNNNKHSN